MPRTLHDKLLKRKLEKNEQKKKILLTEDEGNTLLSSSCNGTIDESFSSLHHLISVPVLSAVHQMGYTNLTDIQSRIIRTLLTSDKNPNIKAIANTGSGKTLAYLLPLVEMVRAVDANDEMGTLAMVVCPTRELAMQTYGVACALLQNCTQKAALVRGGGPKKDEATNLYWGANIVIGTPGRLLDHLKNTTGFNYSCFSSLVVDEADRTFDKGFEKEMTKLLDILKANGPHQTMTFSATDDPRVSAFASRACDSTPVTIDLTGHQEQATVDQLQQEFLLCPTEKRFFVLFFLLKNLSNKKVMVFVNSNYSICLYRRLFELVSINIIAVHGKQTQEERNRGFNTFNRESCGVLMCTDIGARGWDIPVVDLIIQYDPPDDPREYIHRVGRTARGGREGKALVLLREEEWEFVNFMRAHRVKLFEKHVDWDMADQLHGQEYGELVNLAHNNGFMKQLAQTAFRSYIRYYLSHRVKYIYDKRTLDVFKVAQSFLLERPPFTDLNDACKDPGLKKRALNDEKPYFQDILNVEESQMQRGYKTKSFKKSYKS